MTKHKKEDMKIKAEELEKQSEEFRDKYFRVLAEYDNAKKRMEKDTIEIIKFSNESIIRELIPIIDNFDRAYEAAKNHEHDETFSKGVEIILKDFHKLLENNGVSKIKTVGEKFDPHIHEAVTAEYTDKYPEDTIIDEISAGYTLNGRLLRAAKVKISHGIENKEEEIKNG